MKGKWLNVWVFDDAVTLLFFIFIYGLDCVL